MMIWKTVALLTLALCAQARKIPLDDKWQLVNDDGHHRKLIHIGSHEIKHHEGYAPAYPKYEFSYSVDDPHTHDKKAQWEIRDGDEVKGEYWLVQPDGKKRTVSYRDDKHTGFLAHVEYSHHHHPVEYSHHHHPVEYSHHHHPVEEVIIPIVELKEKEPHHDLIQKEESGESKSSEEQREIIKEEEKKEEKEEEEKKIYIHQSKDYEYHTQIEHPSPIYKNHKQEHQEPIRHSPEVHEKQEDEKEDNGPSHKELVDRSYRVSHHSRKTPILRYTKVGASDLELGHAKPLLVDTISGAERRYDLGHPHVELSRLHRRPVPQYLRSRNYRDDSRQKYAQPRNQ